MSTEKRRLVACISGLHVFAVTPGSPADVQIKQYLGANDCPICDAERSKNLPEGLVQVPESELTDDGLAW